jgi:hypothetical protein
MFRFFFALLGSISFAASAYAEGATSAVTSILAKGSRSAVAMAAQDPMPWYAGSASRSVASTSSHIGARQTARAATTGNYGNGLSSTYIAPEPPASPGLFAPPPSSGVITASPSGAANTGMSYSVNDIVKNTRGFFGALNEDIAKAVNRVLSRYGEPTGYIVGEEGGGAVIAGLTYGEGYLHTKWRARSKIYWQGPSLGWDVGAKGSKVLILVYNINHARDMHHTFSGVGGTAYVGGGVGINMQKHENIVLARIHSGLGLRLGANVGYLKYSGKPTWNPF